MDLDGKVLSRGVAVRASCVTSLSITLLDGTEAESTPVFRLPLTQSSAVISRRPGWEGKSVLPVVLPFGVPTTKLCCLTCSQTRVWVSFLTMFGIIHLLPSLTWQLPYSATLHLLLAWCPRTLIQFLSLTLSCGEPVDVSPSKWCWSLEFIPFSA